MTAPNWWQKSAAIRNHPLILTVLFGGGGLAIVAYHLTTHGLGNAVLRRQVLIGLCAGLVYNLFEAWLHRRDPRGYVDQALELGRGLSTVIAGLRQVVSFVCIMTIILTVHNTHMFWPTYGAFLLTMLPFYSDQKSRREDIKARLAEIERGDTIGYPYVMADGHIVLDVNDQSLLLDTGSSRSIGTGELEIDGKTYTLKTRATDVTPEYLSSEIGVKIDALLGMDIIGEYTLIVDPTRQLICFEIMPPESGAAVRIDEYKGIPIIAVTVGGRQIRVFFDTGAPLSYIEPELTENTPVSGTRDHFYAGTGRVTADVYRLDVGIGGETVNLAFGHVPEKLQLILVMAGAQGIIGTELLATHKIALSTSRKKIRLVRL